MRQVVMLLLILSGACIALTGFLPRRAGSDFDLTAFGQLSVQFGTRVLPLDSVARNTLRLFSERTTVKLPKPNAPDEFTSIPASQWFLDVAFRPERAERMPVFSVTHDDVLGLLGQQQKGRQVFSFNDLSPFFEKIQAAAAAADQKRQREEPVSLFESEVSRLRDNLVLFQRLTMSFTPPSDTPVRDYALWQDSLLPGSEAVLAKDAGKPFDEKELDTFAMFARLYMQLSNNAIVGIIPPRTGDPASAPWTNLGSGALAALDPKLPDAFHVNPILLGYAQMGQAVRDDDPAAFNAAVASLQQRLTVPGLESKVRFEAYVNRVEPFFRGSFLYVLAFFCACASWIGWARELRRAALWLMFMGFALHTLGLFARVYLTGYGVVTSLISALQFIGWVAVVVGIVMELLKRGGIGAAGASFVGFAALVVAHSLPFNGDDLELPRAVLATNFWLWTHVTCINIGCGAMFLAGILGAGYILARAVGKLDAANARLLMQLVYGVMCFATLFSFVGTMLGGIWADQSWGRFWGWDPKENGALMIVLWCALWLHARWGKICADRTLMALAVFGMVITTWTLFGVNLLGVGLHSYGFMNGTKVALICFDVAMAALIILAYLPPRFWRAQPAGG